MYSKELEELIENVLADGVITEQERNVLRKRAQACGEDPDEVMVIVEGRLEKAKKAAKPAKEKRGNVVHCPACGALVEAGSTRCKECGYVFTNVEANSSAERFAKELAVIIDKHKDARTDREKEQRDRETNEFIKNFPIPTSKEDMLEFIASMDARRRSNSEYQNAYGTKYKECITKAKVLFIGDPELEKLFAQTEKLNYSGYSQKLYSWCMAHKAIIIAILAVLFLTKPVVRILTTDAGDLYWYEVSEAIEDNKVQDVVSSIGNQTEYSIEKHQGEISSFVRKLVKEDKIEDAEDVVFAVKAIAPKVYVAQTLYDYFMEHDNTSKASMYDKYNFYDENTTDNDDNE